tara:strand:- start:268 stop:1233 length:966 start_codon:yes stop_codon:yes gene_type:complete
LKTLLLYPNINGHYRTYCEILSKELNGEVILIENINVVSLVKFCNKNEICSVVFLHGDSDFLKAFVLKLFNRKQKISIILYYSFLNYSDSIKKYFKFLFIKLLSYINIRLLFLEFDPNKFKILKNKQTISLKDPIVLNPPTKVANTNDFITYFTAGYIDNRKNIKLLIDVLTRMSEIDNLKRNINIIGKQSEQISNYLSSMELPDNIEVFNKNYYFSNEEYEYGLQNCDVVWAYYDRHYGSSSLVINSFFYNKPVIYNNIGVLKDFSDEIQNIFIVEKNKKSDLINMLFKIEKNFKYNTTLRTSFLEKRSIKEFSKIIVNY